MKQVVINYRFTRKITFFIGFYIKITRTHKSMTYLELVQTVSDNLVHLQYLADNYNDINERFMDYINNNGCLLRGDSYAVPRDHPDHANISARLGVLDNLKAGVNRSISETFRSAVAKETLIIELNPNYESQLHGFVDRMSRIHNR